MAPSSLTRQHGLSLLSNDANQGLLDRLQQSAEDIHLPVIVLGEYRYGVKSSRLRAARESWLDELESTAIVLAVTSETSRIYADIRHELRLAGRPIPENDLWIGPFQWFQTFHRFAHIPSTRRGSPPRSGLSFVELLNY